jgi:SAM-dependent methyltransferase
MSNVAGTPEQIQHAFYTRTSAVYDDMHVVPGDEHYLALEFISALINGMGWGTVLDVGAGTGRGVRHFTDRHPDVHVRGVEPVRAMIDEAERRNGISEGCIVEASGTALPFATNSFDVVCELGVLHHVGDPNAIVAEMTRVARRAVFLSDENRFGRGRPAARWLKLGLCRTGLWPLSYRLATRGRGYRLTENDGGVAYSYSVYDALPVLDGWADRVFVLPTEPARANWSNPLLTAHHVLLGALRDG